jgi:hypothetical protein
MSRYLQQLARHAGLTPSGPVGARMASPVAPAPRNDITEEIVERDAVPALPEVSAQAEAKAPPLASPDLPAPSAVHLPAEKNPPTANPAPATRKIGVPESKPSERVGRLPAPSRPVSPDAAAVIQQVIAWVAEPEQRARAAASDYAMPADQLAEENTTAAVPPPAPPATPSRPAAPQPASVQIFPRAPADQAGPPSLQMTAASTPALKSAPAPAAIPPRKDDAPPDFHVSIGSIHLKVEAPPPPPRPAPAPTAPARSSGLSTRARRHYVRSFT